MSSLWQDDDRGAWQQLAVANDLQSRSSGYSRESEEQLASTLIAAFPDPAQDKTSYRPLLLVSPLAQLVRKAASSAYQLLPFV